MEIQNHWDQDAKEKDNSLEIDRENERITSQVSNFLNKLKKEIQSAKNTPDQKLFSFFDEIEKLQVSQEEKEFYQNILFWSFPYLKDGNMNNYERQKIDLEIDFELQKYNILGELKEIEHDLAGISDVNQKLIFLNHKWIKNIKKYETLFIFPNAELQDFYRLILMKLVVLKEKNNFLNPEKIQNFKTHMWAFKYLFEQSLTPERERYDELFDDFFLKLNILLLSPKDETEIGFQFLLIKQSLWKAHIWEWKMDEYQWIFLEMYDQARKWFFWVQEIKYFKEKFKKLSQQVI